MICKSTSVFPHPVSLAVRQSSHNLPLTIVCLMALSRLAMSGSAGTMPRITANRIGASPCAVCFQAPAESDNKKIKDRDPLVGESVKPYYKMDLRRECNFPCSTTNPQR